MGHWFSYNPITLKWKIQLLYYLKDHSDCILFLGGKPLAWEAKRQALQLVSSDIALPF